MSTHSYHPAAGLPGRETKPRRIAPLTLFAGVMLAMTVAYHLLCVHLGQFTVRVALTYLGGMVFIIAAHLMTQRSRPWTKAQRTRIMFWYVLFSYVPTIYLAYSIETAAGRAAFAIMGLIPLAHSLLVFNGRQQMTIQISVCIGYGIAMLMLSGMHPERQPGLGDVFVMLAWVGSCSQIAFFGSFLHRASMSLLEREAQLKAAVEMAAKLALFDDLTSIYNRHQLKGDLRHAWDQSVRRPGQSLSLCLFDLDHFKRINDNFGHAVGDEVLKRVARVLRAAVPADVSFGRYGGEEFLVLMPGVDALQALQIAESIRLAVSRITVSDVAPGMSITASMGVASVVPADFRHLLPEHLLRAADHALFDAKERGRNNSILAPEFTGATTDEASSGQRPAQRSARRTAADPSAAPPTATAQGNPALPFGYGGLQREQLDPVATSDLFQVMVAHLGPLVINLCYLIGCLAVGFINVFSVGAYSLYVLVTIVILTVAFPRMPRGSWVRPKVVMGSILLGAIPTVIAALSITDASARAGMGILGVAPLTGGLMSLGVGAYMVLVAGVVGCYTLGYAVAMQLAPRMVVMPDDLLIWTGMTLTCLSVALSCGYIYTVRMRLVGRSRELRSAIDRLSGMAMRDELTGLPNRRSLVRALNDAIRSSEANDTPLSIAMVDLDRFKRINDAHGHPVGDLVLQRFGKALADEMGRDQIAGRMGGEEFLMVLPEKTLHEAEAIAERLRRRIEQINFSDVVPDLRIEASFGVATHVADESGGNLLERADRALYRAKSLGRNQVATTS